MEKRYKKKTYLIIILFVAIAFFAGILLGKYIETKEQGGINRFMKHLELNTESFLVEQELIGITQDCSLAEERITSLSNELYNLGIMLGKDDAKKNLGKDTYILLKKKFHLMQIRTYLLYHSLEENCETDEQVILFYYGRNNPKSKEQGKILDEVVKKYSVNVFAIEYNYTSELTFLENYYGIEEPPAVVINFDKINNDLTSYSNIVNLIS